MQGSGAPSTSCRVSGTASLRSSPLPMRQLGALLDIDDEGQREARAIGPARIGRVAAIAGEVAVLRRHAAGQWGHVASPLADRPRWQQSPCHGTASPPPAPPPALAHPCAACRRQRRPGSRAQPAHRHPGHRHRASPRPGRRAPRPSPPRSPAGSAAAAASSPAAAAAHRPGTAAPPWPAASRRASRRRRPADAPPAPCGPACRRRSRAAAPPPRASRG